VQDELGFSSAKIEVAAGGTRGMQVTVTVSQADRAAVAELEAALAAFLFEAHVQVE
jgi:fatty-acyl-CoA synthase